MRDRNRRLLCRWLFLMLGFVPTCAVVGYVIALQLPFVLDAERHNWIERIGGGTTAGFSIGQITWPTWGVARLLNTRIRDPETNALLASVDSAEVHESANSTDIIVDSMTVSDGRLNDALTVLHDCLLRRRNGHGQPLRFLVLSLMIQSGGQPFHIHHLRADVERASDSPTIRGQFEISDSKQSECEFLVRRIREHSPPASEIEFHTGAAGIPAAILYELHPTLQLLGPGCRLEGHVRILQSGAMVSGEFAGDVTNVDLETVTAMLPNKLSGRGDLIACGCRYQDGRLQWAKGTLYGRDGAVSRALLVSLAEFLPPLWLPPEVSTSDRDPLPYQRLATKFDISEDGLTLQGTCDSRGSVFVDAEQVLLASRRTPPCAPQRLLRAIVPQSEYQAPATKQTAALVQFFPLPDIALPKTFRSARARIRMNPDRAQND